MGSHLPFTCRDVESCAAALLDGQLSPGEEELVGEHLEQCCACAELIDAMEGQRLIPPRIQLIEETEYWDDMDAVLQAELDRAELEKRPVLSKQLIFVYAAVLLLSLIWGWHQRQRANHLERIVYTQQQTLEQLERLSTSSSHETKAKVSYTPAKMEL